MRQNLAGSQVQIFHSHNKVGWGKARWIHCFHVEFNIFKKVSESRVSSSGTKKKRTKPTGIIAFDLTNSVDFLFNTVNIETVATLFIGKLTSECLRVPSSSTNESWDVGLASRVNKLPSYRTSSMFGNTFRKGRMLRSINSLFDFFTSNYILCH